MLGEIRSLVGMVGGGDREKLEREGEGGTDKKLVYEP